MNIVKFMAYLQEREIQFWLDDGRLRCKGPNEAFNAELNQQIKSRKNEIFQYLERAQTSISQQEISIPKVDRTLQLPLSFAQQRLWFLEQYEGENSLYNMPFSLRINGKLCIPSLKKALATIIERHEALRTTFREIENVPSQQILTTENISFPVEDLRDLNPSDQQIKVETLKSADFQRPFSLSGDLMVRARLIQLEEESFILLMVFHHIAFDGWSWGVFQQELVSLYQAFRDGEASPLPELSIQYADYAVWQKEYLEQGAQQTQLDYWKNRLQGAPSVHQLPLDKPRPAKQSFNGSIYRSTLDQNLLDCLNQLGQKQDATLFMVLQAAFSLLLSRYSRETDILMGTPVANRNHSDLEPLIGFFLNTLTLRTDLSGDPSFTELLQRVRDNLLEDSKNQDVTFAQIVEELKPERSLAYSPFFQIMIILQNNAQAEQTIEGIHFSQFEREETGAKFDLTLDLFEQESGLGCMWEYNTDLFEKESIERMAANFEVLIRSVLEQPNEQISRLPLMSSHEKQQLLLDWNETEQNYPADKTVHALFTEQALKTPKATAVVFENQSMTYSELELQSSQLAHCLINQGVEVGDLVGICMNRSLDMLVGLLAILKTGAAYVPLDPIYPKDRLVVMLEDARVKLLLTEERLITLFESEQTTVLTRESLQPQFGLMQTTTPAVGVTAQDLAYVIYTSGTTGRPKGVQITHQNLVNFLYSMAEKPGLINQDTLLSVTTVCFDIFGLELYLPLLFGGTHHLVSHEVAMDGERLAKLLNSSGATIMQATPTTWKLLLESGWNAEKPLKVLCGGEALPFNLVQALTKLPTIELWNMYGPTETTIWSSVEKITGSETAITIGKPIANTQFYLLDENQNPVPIGAIGEIYIGGDGVAPGYLKRPELTNERFILNPFDSTKSKLYKTGDLGRYLPDGRVECLGRIDHQVKIRGFRIELGEIERTIESHDLVTECVVGIDETASGEKRLIAWLVTSEDKTATLIDSVRESIRSRLPDYMIPSDFMLLETMPLTPNGKVNRKALPKPEDRQANVGELKPASNKLEATILEAWKKVLERDAIGVDQNFFDLGGHSLKIIRLRKELEQQLNQTIEVTTLFEYTTVAQQANLFGSGNTQEPLFSEKDIRTNAKTSRTTTNPAENEIAIVGMYGRFPEADNLDQFRKNLEEGKESIQQISDEELLNAGIDESLINNPAYVKSKNILESIDQFDAPFFGYSPQEAKIIDPQQRLLLEGGWSLLENSGYNPDQYEGWIGVFAGVSFSSYFLDRVIRNKELMNSVGPYPLMMGNDKDFVATRLSYHLGLKGPSITVQTACSTSLVATHMACESIRGGECDMAIVGAASILPGNEGKGYLYTENGIASPDGRCRPFDANAGGTVFGSGVGLILLKRLTEALEENDTIHAVIKGSAINNDGAHKVGFTAPSVRGQATVIANALENAGVSAEDISYVEAHGTGTKMGDPIEISALTQAYRRSTEKNGFCGIGSVKSNIGHLDTVAGLSGLFKTVFAMKQGVIPPTVHFQQPNPEIDFENSPFYVVNELKPWESKTGPKRAGISSFGIGGTNAHLILEEAPVQVETETNQKRKLLPLSAKSPNALKQTVENLKITLEENPDLNLSDVAHTLQNGRKAFDFRQTVSCKNREEAMEQLQTLVESDRLPKAATVDEKVLPVFMFPGQGAQYPNMALELYQQEVKFQAVVDQCCELLRPTLNMDLRTALFPAMFEELSVEEAAETLRQTAITQPALFVIEYALATLWMDPGIKPESMIGHSVGEYVAATLSGVLTLKDALNLLALRGSLIQELPKGEMLAVSTTYEALRPLLDESCSLAAYNSPKLVVLSGTTDAMLRIREKLVAQKIACQPLKTSHGFHSYMMDPILERFEQAVGKVQLSEPTIPYISNVTGTWITKEQVKDPAYWVKHLRGAVLFHQGMEELLKEPGRLYLEVGPGTTLTSLVRQQTNLTDRNRVVPSQRHATGKEDHQECFYRAVGNCWTFGLEINWDQLHEDKARRIPLPTYPFERQSYWIETSDEQAEPTNKEQSDQYDTENRQSPENWYSVPLWKPSILGQTTIGEERKRYLLFVDQLPGETLLIDELVLQGSDLTLVKPGELFEHNSESNTYRLNPENPKEYEQLLRSLMESEKGIPHIIHAWNLCSKSETISGECFSEISLRQGFFSLMFLTQAMGRLRIKDSLTLTVLNNGSQSVTQNETELLPEKATILGICKAIPQEYPNLGCRHIDLDSAAINSRLVKPLVREILIENDETEVAYRSIPRGVKRWIPSYEAVPMASDEAVTQGVRQNGTWLITGGLGNIGLILANWLAETTQAKLILVGRSPFPKKESWNDWLKTHDEQDQTTEKIRQLRQMESAGAEVMIAQADVTDFQQMETLYQNAKNSFGTIHGVIHAAGLIDLEGIQQKSLDSAHRILDAKIKGTLVLDRLLEKEFPECMILCSSVASILAGVGRSDYSAANQFLDQYAQQKWSLDGQRVISINWPIWRNDKALTADLSDQLQKFHDNQMKQGIDPEEGVAVFQKILEQDTFPQIIVSPIDIRALIHQEKEKKRASNNMENRYERPDLEADFEEPENETEKQIAQYWQELLGFQNIGRNDNFFELGGHSLLATNFLTWAREQFSVEIPFARFFENATVAKIAQIIKDFSATDETATQQPLIPAKRGEEPLPLSFGQQRLWLLDQLGEGSENYNLPIALKLEGEVDFSALNQALNRLVQRHESLRTTFSNQTGSPVQVIVESATVNIAINDLTTIDPQEKEVRIRSLMQEEATKPFQLDRDLMLRSSLLKLDKESWILLLTVHHIASDGWSQNLLIREMGELYRACSQGESPELPELPIQYADYSVWQRNWLHGETLAGELKFWKRRLAGIPEAHSLPLDYPRPAVQTFRGANHMRPIDGELLNRLGEIAKREGVTLFMILQSVFALLIARYSGENDIVMGFPVANRDRTETTSLIGFFVNTLVLRTDFSDNPTFIELLRQTQNNLLEAMGHSHLPFEKLVEELQPERNLSVSPIFQIMIGLLNQPEEAINLPNLQLTPMQQEVEVAKFDLTLNLMEQEKGMTAFWDFNTDLFNRETIERMATHFEILLNAVVDSPEKKVVELPMLSPEEKQQILVEWNRTEADYEKNQCLQSLIERQVNRNPKGIAVVFGEKSLTYGELNKKANQLARYLMEKGVQVGNHVGLCMEPSLELPVAIFAILKTGAAYVPLDANYPEERLHYMLKDADIKVLLTLDHLQAKLPKTDQLCLAIDDPEVIKRWDNQSDSNIGTLPGMKPTATAYVIYTSGSTGQPKGVLCHHQGAINMLGDCQARVPMNETSKGALWTSISFDVSVYEIFAPLLTGGTLYPIPAELRMEEEPLFEWLDQNQITACYLPGFYLSGYPEWLQSGKGHSHLCRLLVGVEPIPESLLIALRKTVTTLKIINGYGPSETHICSTLHTVEIEENREGNTPIGTALHNTKLYVLDSFMNPVPQGVPGELFIGGDGVSNGYHNRPELTAERFLDNPFSNEPNAKLYRTGDRVRYREDKVLEFMGRADRQIKLRGFRIEPGDIETALTGYESVSEAVVIVHKDQTDEKRLVGYVVANEEADLIENIYKNLRNTLPEYMVPSALIRLESMPLTQNGKIDRKALPAPDFNEMNANEWSDPETKTEKKLLPILQKILKLEQINMNAGFFELGGHSLLGTRLISQVRKEFDLEIPLKSLFATSTLRDFAALLDQNSGNGSSLLPAVIPSKGESRNALSFAQQRLWFLDQLENSNSASYNMPFVLGMKGELRVEILKQAIAEVVKRHEPIRTNFDVNPDGDPIPRIREANFEALPILDLRNLNETEQNKAVQEQVELEITLPFNLNRDLMLRTKLLRLRDNQYTLLLTMHHIASDGWSFGVLTREIATLYEAFLNKKASPLPELKIQYSDYAVWQRDVMQGEFLEKQIDYWKNELAGIPEVHALPLDFPRPAKESHNGRTCNRLLSSELLDRLNQLSAQHGATLFMTLRSIFSLLLSRYSGEEDIVIGTPVANRPDSSLEPLIGFFVNTLLMRTQIDKNATFGELLEQAKSKTLASLEHQQLSFEQLVEELQPSRSLSYAPIFQIMMTLQNNEQVDIALPNLHLRGEERDKTVSRYDLNLTMSETPEGLECEWEYNADLFEQESIQRMAANFEVLTLGILENPKTKVAQLPLLTESEKQRLLLDWNRTDREYPTNKTVHALFAEQARKTPKATAVVFENETLTYEELDQKSNQLAHYLIDQGVVAGDLVAICLDRSGRMAVGLLAILKAGAAYVPLDPIYPKERLSLMLDDAQVKLLLTEQNSGELFLDNESVTLFWEDSCEQSHSMSTALPEIAKNSEGLAYVIYTSGTTGKPKGVQITHRNLVNFLYSMKEKPGFEASDVLLSVTTICFDIFGLELYLPLLFGGSVHLVSTETAMDGERLMETLDRSAATVMQATPTTWNLLLEMGWNPNQPIKALCGGEQLPQKMVKRLTSFSQVELWNMYGPTETTIWSAVEKLTNGTDKISIGKPIANTIIQILDENLNPVPVGAVGEIFIGGDGVAPGYLNRPELTKERFLENPIDTNQGKLYRTGDLGRYFRDGRIECLGRIDHQVKIRGFRIELGDIESAIQSHDSVSEVVVVARSVMDDEKQLAAYLVAKEDVDIALEAIKSDIRAKLPEYMVPAAFMVLDSLPLTPNGKIDRKALPEPTWEALETENRSDPETETEKRLLPILGRILKRDRINMNAGFFELGGHSLLGSRLINQVRKEFGVEIPLKSIFETPIIREFAALLEQQSDQKQSLLPEIFPANAEERNSLSFAQQRLWFLDQLEGPNSAFNMPLLLRLDGALYVDALKQAIADVIKRHEPLRTTYATDPEGNAIQQIRDLSFESLPIIDLRGFDDEERESEVKEQIEREMTLPFNLAQDLMLRAKLLRLSDSRHILLLTMHHIASDGWSFGVLIREIATLYEAFLDQKPSPLSELEIQYADYAAWQRKVMTGEYLENQINYWKEELAGIPEVHSLPLDFSRPLQESHNGRIYNQKLAPELLNRLNSLSDQQGATLFMVLRSAFSLLLARYSGEDDIVIGTPVANRPVSALEPLIGFFVNTLVMRTQIDRDSTFTELLGQVKTKTLESLEYQQLSFEQLVEELQPSRNLNYAPIFQIMMVLQNNEQVDIDLPGLRMSGEDREHSVSQYDLTLSMAESPDGLACAWEYNADLFERESIERMADNFEVLIRGIIEEPNRKLSKLPLLSVREQQRLLEEWNDTEQEYPADQTVHALFEQQARITPNKRAVIFENDSLTYEELNHQSNQLAHYLISQGVVAGDFVGICLNRSIRMSVGLLAILKAGAAYVPMDPIYPKDRLAMMLEDAEVKLLLSEEKLRDLFTKSETPALLWEEIRNEVSAQSNTMPETEKTAEGTVHVIYTSGSTGKPKGAPLSHRNLVNLLYSIQKQPGLNESDTLLSVTTICFDIFGVEIFLPLLFGGTHHQVSSEVAMDGDQLAHHLKMSEATIMQATPVTWKMLVDSGWQAETPLKVFCGGEPLAPSLAKSLLENGKVELWNMYGPTETTIYSIIQKITSDKNITIGKPVANTVIHLLDQNMNPVPIGAVGEIFIGGDGVAPGGYLKRPEMTEERFLPNPLDDNSGRLYRTGDLGRYFKDGRIEYLGRIDHQIKIRGFRIELGEIESAIRNEPAVREAVVVAKTVSGDEKRLVAYMVANENATIAVDEIKAVIRKSLPEYMVPSAFMILETMPLTPNGKINRKVLPDPVWGDIDGTEWSDPETETEKRLLPILQEILKLERVNMNAGFFELGGHSLLGARLIGKVRQEFGIEIPLKSLFATPIIREFAALMDQQTDQNESLLPEILPAQGEERNRLSFAQQRLWFLDQMEGANSAYNMPAMLRLEGKLNVDLLKQAIAEVIKRHEPLRTTFSTSSDGNAIAIIQDRSIDSLPSVDLQNLTDEEQEARIQKEMEQEMTQPFHLNQDLMLRTKLLRLKENRHVLLLTMHHIASDGWSFGVLTREIATLYEAFLNGQASPLTELTVQYADYAAWQRNVMSGEYLEKQINYWKNELAGIPDVHNLPLDYSRPKKESHKGKTYRYLLSRELLDRLNELGGQFGATLFMTLRSAFSLLLSRYSGENDIVIGSPVANRPVNALEPLIGFFVNTLVMRTRIDGEATFAELLAQAKTKTLESLEYQQLSFEQLVEELQPKRSLSYSPIFQIMMILQNNEQVNIDLPELSLSGEEQERDVSRYDLTLEMEERESGLMTIWEYCTDLFREETIIRLVASFEMLLWEIVKKPEEKLARYSILPESDQQQLLAWNETAAEYPSESTVGSLFSAQAALSPNSVAVSFEGQTMTYSELEIQSNRLANYLRTQGVERGDLVALCMNRSLPMIVALFAILKAGAAYVPLDPIYPAERLQAMLDDALPKLLLTEQQLTELFQQDKTTTLVAETLQQEVESMSYDCPDVAMSAKDRAYVIYTSGTTGKPKGVQITHQNLVNFIYSMKKKPGLKVTDTLLSVTTICFDIFGLELYLPLLFGGTHYLVSNETAVSGETLAEHLKRSNATIMQATPSTWKMLLEAGWKAEAPFKALCGGEPMPQALISGLAGQEHVELWNMYGPTETTIWSTIEQITGSEKKITVGKPIANTDIHILDETLRPVPIGATGEIYIGGDGVASGYYNRPELTQGVFVQNPFADESQIIYRTGDLGRYLPDGRIECLGRKDQQVKLRGFRIELEDIEFHLNSDPATQEAVVTIEGEDEEKVLVAYMVEKEGEEIKPEQLRRELRTKLPFYMVPGEFRLVDAIPKTNNGKIDRKSLARIESQRIESKEEIILPQNEREEKIAEIWKRVLKQEKVGNNQNFFDLGGHSMLLIQLAKGLNDEFEKKMTVVKLFELPTIRLQAEYYEEDEQVEDDKELEKLQAWISKRKSKRSRRR